MKERNLTFWAILLTIFALAAGSARAVEYTHIWIDQATGINHPDTNGTPDEPFKSITYALARAGYMGRAEPWHVHIGPGIYNADANKPPMEPEVFPISLRDGMIFEGADCGDPNNRDVDPNSRIINGRHLVEGLTSLIDGNDTNNLQIRNLTFEDMNHFEGNGGAIELTNCAGTIENCIIRNNTAQSGGGVYLTPHCCGAATSFNFARCTFIDNNSIANVDGSGGGVYIAGGLTGSITDSTFHSNEVIGYGAGGGIGIGGSMIGSVTRCVFTDNIAEGAGAGLYILDSLNGDISNCTFTNNASFWSARGGGFHITRNMNGDISECTFTDNLSSPTKSHAFSYGGGFYIGSTMSGGISECTFTGNVCWRGYHEFNFGGGFYVGALAEDVINCIFTENYAGHYGGGFCVNGTFDANVTGCSFADNSAYYGGGFCAKETVAGAVTNCIFTENSARSYGGGFYANTFENDITNCDFISNAAAGGGYGGGGFCLNYMTGSVEACTFTGNSAGSYGGGGFSVTQSLTGDINDCSFSTNCGEYGGVHVRGSLIGDITGCEFLENSSGSEGAVIGVVYNAFDGKIENCRFLGHEGTAVALGYDCNTPATIRNCLFAAPATLGEVQGWAVRTSQLTTISNNTMVGPGLGMVGPIGLPSAIYIEFDTEAEAGSITNNIITDTGCAIHVDAGMDMPINYNCFYNVADTVCQGEQPLSNECWWLEHLLDNFRDNCCNCDPLFCPDDPIYHIQGSSPCVDAGSPAYAPEAGETDIDGQERIRYGYRTPAVDIGADEYYPLDADLYNDGIVNFVDFAILLTYWQQNEPSADIAPPGGDGIVDFLDLAKLCEDWLRSCSSIGL